MGFSMEDLNRRASQGKKRATTTLKANYDLARRLGFISYEAVVLQSQKREVIIRLAIERGLIQSDSDPKAA